MLKLNTHFSRYSWETSTHFNKTVSTYGTFYIGEEKIKKTIIACSLSKCNTRTDYLEFHKKINGFYSWIKYEKDRLLIAVDHVRSYPLFYAKAKTELYVSDDADWIRCQISDKVFDNFRRDEFILTGYVTGKYTLFPEIMQVEAGKITELNLLENNNFDNNYNHFTFKHVETNLGSVNYLNQKLDIVLDKLFDRLIDYADGRQLVLPLSGGYDSRLIALILKKKNYGNLVTFTYGKVNNKESNFSKVVASQLGLKWIFLEYNSENWTQAWDSQERISFQKFSSNWTSLPHVQDWLAVKILKNKNLIQKDAIFVPGHSGDFVAGSHIPDEVFFHEFKQLEDIDIAIFKRHYKSMPVKHSKYTTKMWLDHIRNTVDCKNCNSNVEYADIFERWDWQERQSKFICNSVRVYEFYGYSWWLPLWDKEFVQFCEIIPLYHRNNRIWLKNYINLKYYEYTNLHFSKNAADRKSFLIILKSIVIKLTKGIFFKKWQKYKYNNNVTMPHFRIDRTFSDRLLKKSFRLHGVEAKAFLKNFKF